MTNTIVYQSGYAIFGTGADLKAAVDNANQWTDAALDLADVQAAPHSETDGVMYYAKATQRLVDAVAARGGDVGYSVRDGLADLDD